MAKDKPTQASDDKKSKKRGFFGFLKRKGTIVKDKSNSDVTVFLVNDKEYTVETSHGKFNRYKDELKSGKSSLTKEALSDAEKGYRIGVIQTMGAQAHAYKKSKGQ